MPNNLPVVTPEWIPGALARPACITMATALTLRVTLQHDATTTAPDAGLALQGRVTIRNVATPFNVPALAPCAAGGLVQFDIVAPVVSPLINVTQVRLNTFSLTHNAASPVQLPAQVVQLETYTIFGQPFSDNVRESIMVEPGAVMVAGGIQRLQPFFLQEHVRQACTWARGTHLLNTNNVQTDIVLKVVRSIPKTSLRTAHGNIPANSIVYGQDNDYFADHDGWNVWDAPQRSADCSQMASFFADVLGVLGVRGHDFELKCEFAHNGQDFRRYFGNPDPDNWPTHGVLLVQYPHNVFQCYDTTFATTAAARVSCTLAQAVATGHHAAFITPGWDLWYLLRNGGVFDLVEEAAREKKRPARSRRIVMTDAQLTTLYPEATWQADMAVKALARFPVAEVQ